MKGVDDITIGMSGPPDSLLISANSNDPALLDEQICSITNLASSMMKISEDAVQGYAYIDTYIMYLYTHMYLYIHTYTESQRYTHRHTYTDRHTHTQTQTHNHTQSHTDTDTHRHRHTHTDTHTQTHTHTHTHTRMHARTHAHTHTVTQNSYKPSHLYSCNDEERVDLVLNTAKLLQDLSSELVVCAKQLVSMSSDKRGGEEHQLLVEKAEILRRDWSAKVRGCGLRDDSEHS